jgi:hypothetical protein
MKDLEKADAATRMRENYETLLKAVKDTAAADKRHLSDKDKMDIQGAMLQLANGYHLAINSNDPEVLRAAVGMVMTGAFFIGLRCSPSLSQKKFWNFRQGGRGGKTTGKKKHADAQIWQKWVLDEIARMNANGKWLWLSAPRIADELKKQRTPVLLPDRDRVARFIRKARKANTVSDKRKAIRLVHNRE